MATPYEKIYSNLLPKFRDYEIPLMTEDEVKQLLNDFITPAISRFHVCDKDLTDIDEDSECFNEDLTNDEIEILSNFALLEFIDSNYIRTPTVLKATSDNVVDGAFDFGQHIEQLEKVAFEKVQEAEAKAIEANEEKENAVTDYTKIKEDYDAIKPKYDDFVKAEQEAEAKAIEEAKTSMFEKFDSSLSENENYKEIKENKDNFTVDEIEQKCSVLFTRMSMENKEQAENVNTDFTANETVGIIEDTDDNVGYVVTKYGNIPTR